MLTPGALATTWVTRLAGARPVVLFDSHHTAVAQPVTGRVSARATAAVDALTGGESAGLYLLTIAAVRLVLRALGDDDGRDARPVILLPAPAGPGELALCAPLDPSAPARDFLADLHAELESAAVHPLTDRAAVVARLAAADPAAADAVGQLAVLVGDDRLATPATTTVVVRREGAGLTVTLEGAGGWPPAAIAVPRCVAAAVTAIVTQPDLPCDDVDILGPEQRAELLDWSRLPAVAELEARTVFGPMDEAAAHRPAAPAVLTRSFMLTHRELQHRSWAAAGVLARVHGIGRGDRVAVLLRRSPELILTILGVLRAGACVVPLDPTHPPARLARQLELSGARCLVTTNTATVPDGTDVELIHPADLLATTDDAPVGEGPGPDDDATMFFTSGSTGQPRPVVITHRQLAHNVIVSGQRVGLDHRTRGAMQAAISSDQLAHNIFTPLVVGGSVVPVDALQEMESTEFWSYLRDTGINSIFCVPSLMAVMAEGLPAGSGQELRHCMLGGDVTPVGLLPRLAKVLRVGTVANMYGPTEATIEAINFVRDGSEMPDILSPPLGTPSPGYSVAVLTQRGDLAPVGVTGEIYIVGPTVADGYRDDEPTGPGRFVELAVAPGARAFRTGDYGRWRADGQVEFLGRRDRQIKVHGNRIELGEIETALAEVPGVTACAVVVVKDAGPTSAIIGAYTTATDLPPETVRAALARRLPPVMVPGRIIQLDAIPLTPVGKVNPAMIVAAAQGSEDLYWNPTDEIGRVVAQIWTEVVGSPPRAATENLFAAGGHSLSAVIIARRAGTALDGHRITVRQILETPTPEGIAAILRRSYDPGDGHLGRPVRPDRLPASSGQRSMWFLEQYEPGEVRPYNTVEAYRLHVPVDAADLTTALRRVVARHEALRTVLRADGDRIEQVVLPPEEAGPEVTVREAEPGRLTSAVEETVHREQRRRAILTHPPVLRAHWLTDRTVGGVLVLAMHHSACDGWSLAVIVRDLLGFLGQGTAAPVDEPVQYADYALDRAARRAHDDRSSEFWARTLAGLPEFTLPLDRPRPVVRDSTAGVARIRLDDHVAARLRSFCGGRQVTTFSAVVAAIRVLLLRWTGASDVALGTVVSGRDDPRLEHSVGFFANTVVLRTPVDPRQDYAALVTAVAEAARQAREHEEHPFDAVVDAVAHRRVAGRNPIFDVLVEAGFSGLLPGDADVARYASHVPVDAGALGFDLAFTVTDAPDGRVEIAVGHRCDVFDHDTARRLADQLGHLVGELVRAPDVPVGSLRALPERERAELLAAGTGPAEVYPAGETLLDLFAARVAAAPDATAVVHAGRKLNFVELDAAADRLAARLAAAGPTGPDRPVAVVCERTEWMVVAMLAVLKTGSAFLPLDVRQSSARLTQLLQVTGAVGVLTDPAGVPELARTGLPVVALEEQSPPVDGPVRRPPAATDLAYVVCTSGSTGVPKGVAVEHRSIVNTVRFRLGYYGLTERDRVLQMAQIHYDGGIVDVFTALAAGSLLVVAGRDQLLDPAEVGTLGRRHQPTHSMMVPSLYQLLLDAAAPALGTLRQVVLGGERVTEALVARHVRRLPRTELHNEYGPAENSVVSTICRLDGGSGEPSIGGPIANQTADLLDSDGHLVPYGAVGELCVGGAGLARGYVADDALTAERFLPSPVRAGTRMYRTGDLARRTSSGVLRFVGRQDDQVKIRGQRIEPGEVAATLARAPGIRQAAVVALPSANGDPRLVAYVVGAADATELRSFLAQRLTEAMLPDTYVAMQALPVTANGKLDRAALPVPLEAAPAPRPAGPVSMSEAERRVADVWSALLGRPVTELDTSLFELGGHSLTAARIGHELGVAVTTVFANPTVRRLARVVPAAGQPVAPAPTGPAPASPGGAPSTGAASNGRAPSTGRVPLSHAQRRVWLAVRRGQTDPFVIATLVRTGRSVDPSALHAALAAVMRRQQVLRLRVVAQGARAEQVVLDPAEVAVPLVVVDLPGADPDGPEVAGHLRAGRAVSFDLARAPLFHVLLITGPRGGDLLLILAHHLVHDGASVQVLLDDLWTAYDRAGSGGDPALPPLAYTYLDWVVAEREWLAGPEAAQQVEFWRHRLAGVAPVPDLVAASRRTARRGDTGFARRTLPWDLVAGASSTPFSIVVAAFTTMVSRVTGADDLVVGFAAGLRHHPAADAIVGYLANAVPLRLRVDRHATLADLLAHVVDRALEAFQHSRLPFDVLAEQLRLLAPPGRSVLLDLGVSWENAVVGADTHVVEDVLPDHLPATSDMWLYASRNGDRLHLDLTYDLNLVYEAEAEAFVDQIAALVGELTDRPDAPVVPDATHQQSFWTGTRYDF